MAKTVEVDACHDSILQELQQFDTSGLIPSSEDVESHARELRHLLGRLEASKGKASLAFTPNTSGFVDLAATTFGDMALTCMRLFRTKDCYVGKGPQSVQVGDEIWIFPDTRVPIILRKIGWGRRRLVGHAYVHGIMDGEEVIKRGWSKCKPTAVVIE